MVQLQMPRCHRCHTAREPVTALHNIMSVMHDDLIRFLVQPSRRL